MQTWVLLQGVGLGGRERVTCSCQGGDEGDAGTGVTWPSELSVSESCRVPSSSRSDTQKAAVKAALEAQEASAPDTQKAKLVLCQPRVLSCCASS